MNAVVKSYLVKDVGTFESVFDFAESLLLNGEGIWRDEYGTTAISMGRNLMPELLRKWDKNSETYGVILSPVIKSHVAVLLNHRFTNNFLNDIDYILSIGGAQEHNIAKEFLLKAKEEIQLINVPVPLSNDSFGTNRSSPCYGKV